MSEAVDVTATVTQVGANFQYNLTLHDVGTTTIGSLWIAWAPGLFFLPHPPSATSAPAGWGAAPFANSVQYAAASAADYVQPGGTLSGFSFTVPDAPSVVFGPSSVPGDQVLTSFAYDSSAIDPGPSDPGVQFVVTSAACFAAGTRILTAAGEIPVERLLASDALPALIGNHVAPVRWLGRTRIDCRRHPRPEGVWPVQIHPGAFGPGRPARPLRLSPDHAVYAGDALVPVRHLINGVTIVQQPVDAIDYWHVELPAHAVLLAEGLPVESYLDTGNRRVLAEAPRSATGQDAAA
jgi:hypothetical protein